MAKSEAPSKKVSHAAVANTLVANIKKQTTLNAMVEQVLEEVAKQGGKPSEDAARSNLRYALKVMEAAGKVSLSKPTDITIEPA